MIHYCFLTSLYNRYDVLMFNRQGKSLVDAGYRVTFLVCDDLPDEIKNGIHIVSTHFKIRKRSDRIFKARKLLLNYAINIDADIYQISDPELVNIADFFHKNNKKVIFNLREFYPTMIMHKEYIPICCRKIISWIYERKFKKELKKFDAVITVTYWIANVLKNQYSVEKTYVVTNFPRVNKDYSLSYEDYLTRSNVLCYEGTIYQSSRQENVFDALQSLPQISYLLAGKIEDSNIKRHPYWSHVNFVDGFKMSELPQIFAQSTICNVFRDFKGEDGSLGVIKIFESMEAALPVLLADVPLYRKIVDKYHCGICVDPNDVDSIKNALEYLILNKREAYEMGQNGRRAVLEEYSWEIQSAKYTDIIQNVLFN